MAKHPSRGVVPSLVLSAVVVLLSLGFARGVWLENLHNGLLSLAFTGVGAYLLLQRPRNTEGLLFTATGVIEAVMFLGRQIGHFSVSASPWWAWLGVWPIPLGLALATVSVVLFPDGRSPSPRWRSVLMAVLGIAGLLALLSAVWPVGYAAAGLSRPPPFQVEGRGVAEDVWSAVAHPAYAVFQLLWVLVIVQRWRAAQSFVRPQLAVLLTAALLSAVALVVGLIGWGTPRAGLLTAALVPVAAGWAIVHGQQVAAYAALSWLSRAQPGTGLLPTSAARAVSEALSAPAVLWMGSEHRLLAVGVWPEMEQEVAATTLIDLVGLGTAHVRPLDREGALVGAVSLVRAEPLSLHEKKLLTDLAAQAALVLEHVSLADVMSSQRLEGLTPREQDVLHLMARGLSNAAICQELHLSIKTVEPLVSTIFTKLGLHADSTSNRRVLAVLAYLRS